MWHALRYTLHTTRQNPEGTRRTVRIGKIKMWELNSRGENVLKCSNEHWIRTERKKMRENEIASNAKYPLPCECERAQTNQMGQSSNCRVAAIRRAAFFLSFLFTAAFGMEHSFGQRCDTSREIGTKKAIRSGLHDRFSELFMAITCRRREHRNTCSMAFAYKLWYSRVDGADTIERD